MVTPSESVLRTGYRGWRFSFHALVRMEEMSVSRDDVVDALNDPQLDYQSLLIRKNRVACRGNLAIPYDPDEKVVITILWHQGLGRNRSKNP